MRMIFGQLSDLHIRPPGVLYQRVVDANQALLDAIAHLKRLDSPLDLVLVTGDVVDHGSPEEYETALALLDQLPAPYLVIPGNHDHREHFRAAMAARHPYLPKTGPLHYCVDDYPVRFIGLDSCLPGLHHGGIDDEGLAWLADTLAADTDKPTVVMLHHPPFVCGIPYMDDYRLMDPAPLADVLAQAPNVEAVLCGHVHRTMIRRWAGTVVFSCPSTATEIDLQLDPSAAPSSHAGPRGCLVHVWDPAEGLVSHVSQIGGGFAGPYPFG